VNRVGISLLVQLFRFQKSLRLAHFERFGAANVNLVTCSPKALENRDSISGASPGDRRSPRTRSKIDVFPKA
jgi:hypothetical protein